jgi:hypothetical protein
LNGIKAQPEKLKDIARIGENIKKLGFDLAGTITSFNNNLTPSAIG